MRTKSISTFLLLCILSFTVKGQADNYLKEGKTRFSGNNKTDIDFLRDQFDQNYNSTLDIESLHSNVQLIKNIPGIKQAILVLDTIGTIVNITYLVEEMNTLVPIISLGSIRNNTWFRIGTTDYNWLGRGQFLSTIYQNNNGLHSGQVFFKIPKRNNSLWGYTASASSWASQEPLYFSDATVDYTYQNHGLGLSAIRHLNGKTTVEVGNTAFLEVYDKVENQVEENLPGPDRLVQQKLLSKLVFTRDYRDYDYFYRQGGRWHLIYQNVITHNEDFLFNSLQFSGQYYYRLSQKINIATRVKIGISTNIESPFAPFVADSHINIRGIGNRISRGTAEAIINVEYRHTITDNHNWATQFVTFSDLGSWRKPGGDITEIIDSEVVRHFVGIGSRWIYKKLFGATLRIDYSIDLYDSNNHGLVLGLGQYF